MNPTMRILKSHHGVALLMVMSSIVILTALLANFTYQTELNKIKTSNIQEKLQARLNAEAGLNFALTKLRLYQEARNKLSKNKSLKAFVKPRLLENLITQPFIYPIPGLDQDDLNLAQKNALEAFEEQLLVQGSINLSMQKVQGFLNPNNMRIIKKPPPSYQENPNPNPQEEEQKKTPQEIVEQELITMLTNKLQSKMESDPLFQELYGDTKPLLLVKELAFYINNPDDLDFPEKGEINSLYLQKDVTPKHAPLTSIEELYLLEGWPDDIINLVKDQLTVHEANIIPINELVQSQLENLFPEIEPENWITFFKYRDGDPEEEQGPSPFDGEPDFKSFLVNEMSLEEEVYQKRAEELETAGLKFGISGKLYKVVSIGRFNRAEYKITAFIDLPIAPPPKEKKETKQNQSNQKRKKKKKKKKKKKYPEILEKPRIVEIRLG